MTYGIVVGVLLLTIAMWRATDQQDEQSRLKTLPTIAATLNEPTAPPATTLTTSTTQPATEPPTTESPLPTDPPTTESPLETLTDAIRQATGNTNVTVKEFATLNVTLYFPLDAHLYAHTQATAALQVIQSLRPDIDVVIIVTADLHNKLGETQVGRVILGTYTSETIQRINFANFDPNNVFDTEVGDIITYTMQACELTYYC